jgi:hypothetical protein
MQSAQDAVPQYEVATESKLHKTLANTEGNAACGVGHEDQTPGRDSELLWLVLAPCLPAS